MIGRGRQTVFLHLVCYLCNLLVWYLPPLLVSFCLPASLTAELFPQRATNGFVVTLYKLSLEPCSGPRQVRNVFIHLSVSQWMPLVLTYTVKCIFLSAPGLSTLNIKRKGQQKWEAEERGKSDPSSYIVLFSSLATITPFLPAGCFWQKAITHVSFFWSHTSIDRMPSLVPFKNLYMAFGKINKFYHVALL